MQNKKLPDINGIVFEKLNGYNKPDDDTIAYYENELGLKFHDLYKIFLKQLSDCVVDDYDFFTLTPSNQKPFFSDLITEAVKAWGLGVPRNWIPFCEDNGNYFCVDEEGVVHYWDHNGPTDERWDNLADWMQQVLIDEN